MRAQCRIVSGMSGNPKGSKWYSTPRNKRARPGIQICLSDEARQALDELAGPGARSALIERLILEAQKKRASAG